MNLAKLSFSSAIKSTLNQKPTLRTTLTLSILDTLLQKCPNPKQFNQILCQMILTGFIKDTYASSRLLKFSTDSPFIDIDYSHKIFNHIEDSNGFIWNTMMRAYLQRNNPQKAIFLYKLMLENNVDPDNYTYPILVQVAALRFSEFEGNELHDHVLKMGFDSDVYVQNTLINMYAVCGNINDARKLFDESPVLDLVSWNSMLAGYVQMGDVEEAKLIFDRMPKKNLIASNSMIVLFGRSGHMGEASRLFNAMEEKNMVTWTALISCYEQNEMYEEALFIFMQMKANGVMVDEVVVVSLLSACANLSIIKTGKSIHGLVLRIGVESYVNLQNALIHMYSNCGDIMAAQELFNMSYHLDQISWNSMISGYLKCGSVEKARSLFDSMPEKDIVSWCAMISGYAQLDQFSETLELFQKMQLEDIKPDEITLVSVISACTHLAALEQGKWIHAYIRKNGLKVNVILGTTLIDMYMKCGCVENALEVFYGMEERGVSSWNALIVGFAMNGLVERSLEMFSEMKNSGVLPNEITFVGVLGACRHMGLVDEGRHHFESMISTHMVEPNVKHYGCMVDLLGRAGLLKEAEELIDSMPMAPDAATWGALLGACKKHGDNEMGERIGRKLVELQPDHDGFHVLLSNIYASKGNWDDVLEIRETMMQHRVIKTPGCSMIEVNGVVHEFLAGDKTHPQINEIEEVLDEVAKRLKMLGYAPDTNEVFLDIDEEEKETNLFRHSEKLAIAFGLITTSPPTPIRIMKNLRICNDCHAAAKLISQAFNREIVLRDRHRFHHFKQGLCSCKEYW
ncbi:pentatricopeptide repeat-containing protein At3g62890-like [Cornus florida]|uniref:pentatricopeptide repeat-containing protein At3g62890-like n=1 Tax=Cornus florida TaxID=4283 RepID=UPI00289E1AB3|nr:pentatricopeptide repeat-containing protein At3g62890-like [Cornus florida]XP_059652256.1 pentatricopeptide repeat-containing protein At3g62890-like [Cornus florida]XP_059652257.1 pentatricopeptide repeat-containing protein At3g62890-like [Cornus florida]XP_059652258.1 pentatricopeptide repeat-containing protein At3g62890-like [Cornus florida]XP_059652259.1 pentatricopeptide repeat-containing protein At3g62890-like [Cornus florida]XP_059652260.1 pentatricopeptide repeat-containing protein A